MLIAAACHQGPAIVNRYAIFGVKRAAVNAVQQPRICAALGSGIRDRRKQIVMRFGKRKPAICFALILPRPQGLIHLIIGARHQRVRHAGKLLRTGQIPGDIFCLMVKTAIGVSATRHNPAVRIDGGNAHFIIIILALVPAQRHTRAPVVTKLPVVVGIQRFIMAPGVASFIIQPIFVADINRAVMDKRRTAIVRNIILVIFVTQQKAGFLAIPLQRGCDEPVFITTKIAPVILVLLLCDQPESKTVIQWSGDIERTAAAAAAGGPAAQRGTPFIKRFFADDIDDAARILDAVEQ